MAYSGYLLKLDKTNYIFPKKHINWDSYKSKPGQRQSLDAYTDLDGLTHDNALPHTKTEITFSTLPMSEKEWEQLMGNVRANYLVPEARDLNITYFDFEQCIYRSGHFYLDKSFQASANVVGGKLRYNEAAWTFIEY